MKAKAIVPLTPISLRSSTARYIAIEHIYSMRFDRLCPVFVGLFGYEVRMSRQIDIYILDWYLVTKESSDIDVKN